MMELKTFAVTVYSETGVAQACLTLQDQEHVDVPLLLFCGWYGTCYGQIPCAQLTQAREISKQLGNRLIKPLRQVRRWMKTHSVDIRSELRWNTLREDIKRAELEAEMLMLDTLASMVASAGDDAGANFIASASGQPDQQAVILHNLRLLVQHDNVISGDTEQLLQLISAACFRAAQVK